MCEKLGNSRGNCGNHRNHSKRNCPAGEALSLPVLGVAMSYIDFTAYECQSFRCSYDFTWRKGRVRLDFQEIIFTIPEFALHKDSKLAGLGAIDHFPKIRSICHNPSFKVGHKCKAGARRSSFVFLRKLRGEVPKKAEERFVLNFVIDCRAARRVASMPSVERRFLVSLARLRPE